MATNKNAELGIQVYLPVASGVKSGDPVIVGRIKGVALFDRDSSNSSSVDLMGVYNLSVAAINDAGNVAVAAGDAIYYVDNDTPKLSKKMSGSLFGFALDAITSGSTATIRVLLHSKVAPGLADTGIFVSAEQTGTGSAQNIAHGLARVPSQVFAAPTDTSPSTAGVYTITEGTHTSTNVVVTVTSGKKFKVIAFA